MIFGSFDIEHSAHVYRPWEEGFYITCISAVDDFGTKQVWWLDHCEIPTYNMREILLEFQAWLYTLDMVGAFNLKHDMNIMRYYDIDFERTKLYDPMIADYLITGQDVQNKNFNLNDVSIRYGMEPKLDKVKEYWDNGVDTYDIPKHILDPYVLDDAEKVQELYKLQQPIIIKQKQGQLIKLHNEFTRSLSDMELNGFKWDTERSLDIYNEYNGKVTQIEEDLAEIAGDRRINFNSPQQLGAFLFGGDCKVSWSEWVTKEIKKENATRYYEKTFTDNIHLKGIFRPPKRRKRDQDKQLPTDKSTISDLPARTKIQRNVKKLLIERSEVQKVAETLIGKRTKSGLNRKVQSDGRIHTKFNQTVTATGRLSSSDPNGQNLPRGSTSPIKECIIPTLDWIVEYDLKQVEWKSDGELAHDIVMIQEINAGVDQHSASCVELMEQPLTDENRYGAKRFNFRMIYGGSAYGFFMDTEMPRFPIEKWNKIVSNFGNKYYGLAEYNARNIETVLKGGVVSLFTGRRFVFNKTIFKDGIWQYNENQIKNYPVQGLAGGDLLPLVTAIIRKGLKIHQLKSKFFITVHDSLGFDAITEEVPILYKICTEVGDNLAKYVYKYWGYKCSVTKWGGDFKVGKNYGKLIKYEDWLNETRATINL